ncbi:lipopolysaccharide-binding protein isoform 2-T2 [Callospermophilus lateralis]|uniref:lipopolysaccharide-binding protein isoform X2 n=1 Tax=Callospermophilus lateralis TaxID=76772 RepID=UPI004038D6EE
MAALARALLAVLLGILLTPAPGALGTNPGLVARITDKGLEYAAREGLVTLQKKLRETKLPDFFGDFRIKHVGRGHYEFHSLDIPSCELSGSALKPLAGRGLSLTISDSSVQVQGRWKVRMSFLKMDGHFNVHVKGITISVTLLLGSEDLGRPTVTTSSCNSHIRDLDVDISGDLRWLLKLFHDQIESKFRKMLETKICSMIDKSVTSDLQPYLQTLPVMAEIDSFAGVDYSLTEAPRATANMLDMMFKGEVFHLNHRSAVPFLAPVISVPEDHDRMLYFAVSNYVFNTASRVYYQAGHLNFSITDDMIPPDSVIRLTTKSFRAFLPLIGKLYPNMDLELQGALLRAPLLTFSPGNLSLAPQLGIDGFVLLPNSLKQFVFRLGVVEMMEALLNYYIQGTLYPKVNDKLAEGFPLPLPRHIQLHDLLLQIHKDFLFLGANVQYMRV